jgi:hypothetical protein
MEAHGQNASGSGEKLGGGVQMARGGIGDGWIERRSEP